MICPRCFDLVPHPDVDFYGRVLCPGCGADLLHQRSKWPKEPQNATEPGGSPPQTNAAGLRGGAS